MSLRSLFILLLVLSCSVWACKESSSQKTPSPDASASSRPAPPRPRAKPICEEGKLTKVRCLSFCGTGKILGPARCKNNDHHCENGVREDKCE